jgi:hypothetical protein
MTFLKIFIFSSFIFYFGDCFGQTKSFDIVYEFGRCDNCKTKLNDTGRKFDFDVQYRNLKNAVVNIDLAKAIDNNDLRFVAISGVGILYPGLETQNKLLIRKYDFYKLKYGFKVIRGTNDVVMPDKPPLQVAAYNYAKKYNTLLLKYLDKKTTKNRQHEIKYCRQHSVPAMLARRNNNRLL